MLFSSITKRKIRVTMEELVYMSKNLNFIFKDLDPKYENLTKLKDIEDLGYFLLYVEDDVAEEVKEILVI